MAKFRADGLQIWKEPEKTKLGFKLGFVVCEVNDNLEDPERMARVIADVLSKAPVFD